MKSGVAEEAVTPLSFVKFEAIATTIGALADGEVFFTPLIESGNSKENGQVRLYVKIRNDGGRSVIKPLGGGKRSEMFLPRTPAVRDIM